MPRSPKSWRDQWKSAPAGKIGEYSVEPWISIERIDLAMEQVLYRHEQFVTRATPERVMLHDRPVETLMHLIRRHLQSLRPRESKVCCESCHVGIAFPSSLVFRPAAASVRQSIESQNR